MIEPIVDGHGDIVVDLGADQRPGNLVVIDERPGSGAAQVDVG